MWVFRQWKGLCCCGLSVPVSAKEKENLRLLGTTLACHAFHTPKVIRIPTTHISYLKYGIMIICVYFASFILSLIRLGCKTVCSVMIRLSRIKIQRKQHCFTYGWSLTGLSILSKNKCHNSKRLIGWSTLEFSKQS